MKELWLVGIGPGSAAHLTEAARAAMERADVLCGYTVYVELMRPLFPGKETFTTPMTQELERCRMALEQASGGKTVAMLCSGDAGVYGMAGPVLELSPSYPEVDIQIVPGVTAALSGAALLGAPLMNDFCVISLSDRLTPRETIEKRLRCAAEGDFAVCLYNPASKTRRDRLAKACDILLACRPPETVCGWVRNIGRAGQEKKLLTLAELREETTDMFTTVFIGCGATRRIGDSMVTLRGYEEKR